MAFRTETLLVACLMAAGARAELRYSVRHDHLWKSGTGTLVIRETGVSFQETARSRHGWNWAWDQIQQLKVSPRSLHLLTYEDDGWQLGRDRRHRFDLVGPGGFFQAWELLRSRLDQRLVGALVSPEARPSWEMPAKLLGRFGGTHGTLIQTEEGLAFRTDKPGAARTWRWRDLENLSSTGPFQLTITTYERSLLGYGNLTSFRFQLKQPLEETRFRELWLRLSRNQGLKLLTAYTEGRNQP